MTHPGNDPAQHSWNPPPEGQPAGGGSPYGGQQPAWGEPPTGGHPYGGQQYGGQQYGGQLQGSGGSQMNPQDERTWAMAGHLGSFVLAWAAVGFIAPLFVLLAKGGDSPFVRRHAVESLNFQITALILALLATPVGFVMFLLAVVTLGVTAVVFGAVVIAFLAYYFVAVIQAGIAASRGQEYRYPINIRMVS